MKNLKNSYLDQEISKSTFESSGLTGVIHHHNVGFLLHGTTTGSGVHNDANFVYAGEDEHSDNDPASHSSVRVYARKINSGHDIYSSTYSLTPSQPTSLFDICGSFIDRREIIPTKANVSKTVAQFTTAASNYLVIPYAPVFSSPAFTVSFWVKFDSPVTEDFIYLISQLETSKGIYIGTSNGSDKTKFRYVIRSSGGSIEIIYFSDDDLERIIDLLQSI